MAKEMIINTKTGTKAEVIARYNRRTDGKGMVHAETVHGAKVYWLAAHVEAA